MRTKPKPSRAATLRDIGDLASLAEYGAIALGDSLRIDTPHVRKRIGEIKAELVRVVKAKSPKGRTR